MARSNKPIVWGPFAAGGTVTAFVTPVLILITLLASLGHAPDAVSYETMRAFAGHWLGKLVIFGVIALSLWASAHRLRITFYDCGLRADGGVAAVLYAATIAGTAALAVFLWRL